MERLEFRSMGSGILVALDSDGPRARARLALVPGWFEDWEACLSRFRPESELSRLNASPGERVPVSRVLWDVMEVAFRAAHLSRGLVAPTVFHALQAAGYDRTWEEVRSGGPRGHISRDSSIPDMRLVERDSRRHTVRLPAGTSLDLGGIGKGWAADRAAHRLSRLGPSLVDAGGDIAVSGPTVRGDPWPIGVADPLHDDRQIAVLRIGKGGVATSGRDYRRWQAEGAWAHHIIDPRTGRPAETDILSATLVGPSARMAEAAAKTMLILGSRAGLSWVENHPALAGLAVLDDGRVLVSRRMKSHLWSQE